MNQELLEMNMESKKEKRCISENFQNPVHIKCVSGEFCIK